MIQILVALIIVKLWSKLAYALQWHLTLNVAERSSLEHANVETQFGERQVL